MKQGKIYKMENEYGTYYGSTIKSLKDRLSNHKAEAKHKKKKEGGGFLEPPVENIFE